MRSEEPASAVYVYGVVRTGSVGTLPDEGVEGGPITVVETDGLAAVVTHLRGDTLRVRRRELERHLGVLQQLSDQTTVVACSFGSVLQSEETVREYLLQARRDDLLEQLRRLDGRVQLNVKASYDEDAVLHEIVAGEPEIARLRARTRSVGSEGYYENVRMGELVAQALAARRTDDAQQIFDRLASEAESVALEDTDGLVVLKGSFLVADDRRETFDGAVEELADAHAPRLHFELVGPLPPTAFVTVEAP